jgi:hypothetical protein
MISTASAFVMPGHSPSKMGVKALMPGHPRVYCGQGVDGRNKSGHDANKWVNRDGNGL